MSQSQQLLQSKQPSVTTYGTGESKEQQPTAMNGIEAAAALPPPTRVPITSAIASATTSHAPTTDATQQPPAASTTSTTNSTTTTSAITQAANQIAAIDPAQLPTSSRSKYRTYILSSGVFEVEQRYEIREVIGQGAYGVVCSAKDHKTGRLMAVKKIENVFDHRSLAKRTLRELKLVRSFQHENILGLERVMRPHSNTFNNIYLVSELMETDLACVIRSPQDLSDEHCQFFIYQVLRGLKYIHSANVIHRDLKPRNLLVNSNCDLRICDFGLARVDDPENHDRAVMSNYIATRWYRAPEVILGRKRYTKAVDMWSVGCILAELIGRKPIFPGRDSFHQITLIVSVLGTPPPPTAAEKNGSRKTTTSSSSGPTDDYISALPKKPKIPFRQLYPKASPLACDLLDQLLCFDPDKRLTVEQALKHPYLGDLHSEDDEPICRSLDLTDFYFEYLKCTKEDLRVLIHQEIVNHYKEESYEYMANATPLDSFNKTLMTTLPKGAQQPAVPTESTTGKKGRRKSF